MIVLAFTRSGPGVLEVDQLRPEWRLIDYARLPPMSAGLWERFTLPPTMERLAERRFTLEYHGFTGTFAEIARHEWTRWGLAPFHLGNPRGDFWGLKVPIYLEQPPQ